VSPLISTHSLFQFKNKSYVIIQFDHAVAQTVRNWLLNAEALVQSWVILFFGVILCPYWNLDNVTWSGSTTDELEIIREEGDLFERQNMLQFAGKTENSHKIFAPLAE
jgi:hypothetical protein